MTSSTVAPRSCACSFIDSSLRDRLSAVTVSSTGLFLEVSLMFSSSKTGSPGCVSISVSGTRCYKCCSWSCGRLSDNGDHDSDTFDRVWVEMDTFKNYDTNFDRSGPSARVRRWSFASLADMDGAVCMQVVSSSQTCGIKTCRIIVFGLCCRLIGLENAILSYFFFDILRDRFQVAYCLSLQMVIRVVQHAKVKLRACKVEASLLSGRNCLQCISFRQMTTSNPCSE